MKPNNLNHTRIILDSIADGLFTVDSDFNITSFNRAAEKITGVSRRQAIGKPCWRVFRTGICDTGCVLQHSIKTGEPVVNREITITNASGGRVPISVSTAILKDASGRVIGGVETFRDLTAEKALRAELADHLAFENIVARDPQMQSLFRLVEAVAATDVTVLIEGESGTGKGLFARAVHAQSGRRKGPFVTVDCGALPQSLLESELFGYKAGAFTDAKKDKPGRLALARGGTLFLDEIGDTALSVQVKLLRLLQEKVYEPLGSVKPETTDARIVVATNRPLEEQVKLGHFREDLYYRIKVMKLTLPPLRARRGDIPLLAEHFIRKQRVVGGREITGLAPEVMAQLMVYDWPGNVRELENVIEYASVVCPDGRIRPDHLPEDVKAQIEAAMTSTAPPVEKKGVGLAELEKAYLSDLLKRNDYNRKATATAMGVHPSTLWRKMKRLGLALPATDGRSKQPD